MVTVVQHGLNIDENHLDEWKSMYLKTFLVQLGFNILLYATFCNQLNIEVTNIFSLIIHVTFFTMICNYASCLVQHRYEQKYNPEWFFIPMLQWSEIKQSLHHS